MTPKVEYQWFLVDRSTPATELASLNTLGEEGWDIRYFGEENSPGSKMFYAMFMRQSAWQRI